ncbi:hypothetical protein DFH06DRAFT_1336324 [Mycena polygramma]|nr:hypothetical protein DFH06DRAFT_1336324 [Mycena polygramma]
MARQWHSHTASMRVSPAPARVKPAPVASFSPSPFLKRYNTAIAIILESGAIYCIGTVLSIVAGSAVTQATLSPHHLVSGSTSPIAAIFEASLPQILDAVSAIPLHNMGDKRSLVQGLQAVLNEVWEASQLPPS